MQGASEQVVLFITTYGIKIIGAIIILYHRSFSGGHGPKDLKRGIGKERCGSFHRLFCSFSDLCPYSDLYGAGSTGKIRNSDGVLHCCTGRSRFLPLALPCKAPWPILRPEF